MDSKGTPYPCSLPTLQKSVLEQTKSKEETMITYTTVLLLRNIDLFFHFTVRHYKAGEVEMPSDLARLCIRNKWAKPIKIAAHGNPKHNN